MKNEIFAKVIRHITGGGHRTIPQEESSVAGVDGMAPWAAMHAYRFARALDVTAAHAPDRNLIVDVGAYPGTILRLCRDLMEDPKVIGVGMLFDEAFRREMSDLNIDLVECNVDPAVTFNDAERQIPARIDLPDNSVSLLFFMETIEHLYNLQHVLPEIHRVLKPGGIVYCTTNNIAHLPGLVRVLRGGSNLDADISHTSLLMSTQWRGHVRFYSLSELTGVFRRFGFEVLNSTHVEMLLMYGSPLKRGPIYRLIKGALRRFGGPYRSHVEVVCRKPR